MPETKALIKSEKIQEQVLARVNQLQNEGKLQLPPNYSAGNALNAAYLILQETTDRNSKPALEVCTQASVANAMLSMCIQGLQPDKHQAYFIVYGNKLQMQRSYFGSMAVAKRVNSNIKDFNPQVIYEDDTVETEIRNGKEYVTRHTRSFSNINREKIIGAYCTVELFDGEPYSVVMTIDEIKQAWKQSKMNPVDESGNIKQSSTHGKFTAEMAQKTVVNRAAKKIINESDDHNIVAQFARQSDLELARSEVETEIAGNANKGPVIDASTMEVEDADYMEVEPPQKSQKASQPPSAPAPGVEESESGN